MQRGASLEVAATLDERDTRNRLDRAFPVADCRVGSHHPLTIRRRDVDRGAAEGLTPLDADAAEMWMRHRDPVKSAARPHGRDAHVIDEPKTVPEEVAGWRLHEQGPLTNADLRISADPGQPRLEVADLDPSPLGPQLVKRRPMLTGRWHVLSLIVAD